MAKKNLNRTKIVATVGPACDSITSLTALKRAGVSVFRLNFSHSTHQQHEERIARIRKINENESVPIAILMDLQGPKIRIGDIKNGYTDLKIGKKLTITTENILGSSNKISTSYKGLPEDVQIGDVILIDDGNIELKVQDKSQNEVFTKILHGGRLKSKKGINLPGTNISAPSLTKKDKEDLMFALQRDADWIALSFVRSAKDVRDLRKIINKQGKSTRIVSKIEKPEAVADIDAIIKESDALMVARGDLGVEIPMEQVPLVQKKIIRKCNQCSKPVIVATQMLESMIQNPRPTRAEASDIANAIMDGADAVMLSGETAAGKFPALAARAMAKIIRSVEATTKVIYNKNYDVDLKSPTYLSDRILAAATMLACETGASKLTGMTMSGYTAFKLARHRPDADIFIFTGDLTLQRQLGLVWGVRAFFYSNFESTDDAFDDIIQILLDNGFIKNGDTVVTTGTIPVSSRKRTNSVRINVIEH